MRILVSGETSSIHTARWVNQLKSTGWDVHVYHAAGSGTGIAEEFEYGTLHVPFPQTPRPGTSVVTTLPSSSLLARIRRHSGGLNAAMNRRHAHYLTALIKQLQPDVIHSLGLNVGWSNLCAPVIGARMALGKGFSAPWVYSSWGTDLDYYPTLSEANRHEVETVLRSCDYYVTECDRDARLAREMGLRGEIAAKLPAFGGVQWNHIASLRQPGPVSERRTIFIKGRDHGNGGDPVGRAMVAMKALGMCSDVLRDYRVIVGAASPNVAAEAAVLRATKGIDVQVLPFVPYDAVLRIIGSSRLFIALTVNDGLPSTLVEAMALGAMPLHSDLEPIAEWVSNGENGLLVPAEDVETAADALRRALSDDALVDRSAETNERLVRENLTEDVVRPKVVALYEEIVGRGPILPR